MAIKDLSFKFKGGQTGVLLIHGLCGTPGEMRYVANGLARAGFTVHCPQLAGHGGLEKDVTASTWADWYASVEQALMDLRRECTTVIVGGLSTGAVLSLMLAARRPADVQGLALFSPTLVANGWNVPWYSRLFKLVQSRWLANRFNFADQAPYGIKDKRIREFFVNALFNAEGEAGVPSTPGGALFEHGRLVKALRPLLKTITQPTLILHPREDDIADLSNAFELQRKLAGTVELTVLEDSYHNCTIDRQRGLVVDRTTAFTARLAEQAGAKAKAVAATVTRIAA